MKSVLVNTCPSVRVSAKGGVVYVDTQVGPAVAEPLAEELKSQAQGIPGVKEIRINISPTATFFSD